MSLSDQIKDLIRTGMKDGYILRGELYKCISSLPSSDQSYICNTIEGFKIQIIDDINDYDELKYVSGSDAIEFLKKLSDGRYSAFKPNKDED